MKFYYSTIKLISSLDSVANATWKIYSTGKFNPTKQHNF